MRHRRRTLRYTASTGRDVMTEQELVQIKRIFAAMLDGTRVPHDSSPAELARYGMAARAVHMIDALRDAMRRGDALFAAGGWIDREVARIRADNAARAGIVE